MSGVKLGSLRRVPFQRARATPVEGRVVVDPLRQGLVTMLGWIFDSSARATCRAYGAFAGHQPFPCLVNGGRPLRQGLVTMLGWIFDLSARATCRAYGAVAGHLPYPCLVNGGRPLLALIAGTVVVLFALFLVVRAARA